MCFDNCPRRIVNQVGRPHLPGQLRSTISPFGPSSLPVPLMPETPSPSSSQPSTGSQKRMSAGGSPSQSSFSSKRRRVLRDSQKPFSTQLDSGGAFDLLPEMQSSQDLPQTTPEDLESESELAATQARVKLKAPARGSRAATRGKRSSVA